MADTIYVWSNWTSSTPITTGSTITWTQWIDPNTTSSATTTWTTWTSANATVTATGTGSTWYQWTSTGEVSGNGYTRYEQRQLTPEEIQQQEEQRRVQEARYQEQLKAQQEARAKAEKLLKDHLTKEQLKDLEEKAHFYVRSQSGKLYRIHRGIHGNVYRLNEATKQEEERLCVAPVCPETRYNVPEGDAMLAQKLYLEAAEESFRQKANITPLRRAA